MLPLEMTVITWTIERLWLRGQVLPLIRFLAKGLLGRLLGYGLVGLGFWLLLRGFTQYQYLWAAGGIVLIPAGLWLLAQMRRQEARQSRAAAAASQPKEDRPGDLLDGRDQSN